MQQQQQPAHVADDESGGSSKHVLAPSHGTAVAPAEKIPNFVKQYYETSTFSHLSTWRLQIQKAAADMIHAKRKLLLAGGDPCVAAPANPPHSAESESGLIAHIDLDCFYVSVAIRDDPSLAGRCVIVCPTSNSKLDNSTSEVASCSYEARQFGVKSRMFIRDALRLCPEPVVIPCTYDKYAAASLKFFQVLLQYTLRIQPLSADEAFLDLGEHGDQAEEVVRQIRADVLREIGCPCSAGIAHNRFLARLATKRAKPNSQYRLLPELVRDFLEPLSVRDLPGVGESTAKKLDALGVSNVQQLVLLPEARLQRELGLKLGSMLYNRARGIDSAALTLDHERKSVGTQISWGVRFQEPEQLRQFLFDLAAEVSERMQQVDKLGTRVTLRIKRKEPGGRDSIKYMNPGQVQVLTRSEVLHGGATCDAALIGEAAYRIWRSQMHVNIKDVRGAALTVDRLQDRDLNKTTPSSSASSGTGSSLRRETCLTRFIRSARSTTAATAQPLSPESPPQDQRDNEDDDDDDTDGDADGDADGDTGGLGFFLPESAIESDDDDDEQLEAPSGTIDELADSGSELDGDEAATIATATTTTDSTRDNDSVQAECPICSAFVSVALIESHAARCCAINEAAAAAAQKRAQQQPKLPPAASKPVRGRPGPKRGAKKASLAARGGLGSDVSQPASKRLKQSTLAGFVRQTND